jgi:hypothetical protein
MKTSSFIFVAFFYTATLSAQPLDYLSTYVSLIEVDDEVVAIREGDLLRKVAGHVGSKEELQTFIKNKLGELTTVSPIINDVFQVDTLIMKENINKGRFKTLFAKFDWDAHPYLGGFHPMTGDVVIPKAGSKINTRGDLSWLSTLVHEHTHQLMYILYKSPVAAPYFDSDDEKALVFADVMNLVQEKLWQYQTMKKAYRMAPYPPMEGMTASYSQNHCVSNVIDTLQAVEEYDQVVWPAEYVARYPHLLAEIQGNCFFSDDDAEKFREMEIINDILSPLADFWRVHINPDIQSFLTL